MQASADLGKRGAILILILILSFTAGCSNEAINYEAEKQLLNAQLTTDKELYHSNEVMKISLDAESDKEMGNTTIKLYGIYAGSNRLELSRDADIASGDNKIDFEFTTPSCNRCSGISPGNYTITAEILKNGSIVAKTAKEIEIQQ